MHHVDLCDRRNFKAHSRRAQLTPRLMVSHLNEETKAWSSRREGADLLPPTMLAGIRAGLFLCPRLKSSAPDVGSA